MSNSANTPATAEDLLKAKVLSAAAALASTGAKVNPRMDERETSNGLTRYFQFETDLASIANLDATLLEGLLVTVTVAAYQGSYTGKEALEKTAATSAANAFANFGKR